MSRTNRKQAMAVVFVYCDGREKTIATFDRFDLGARYAEVAANALARKDGKAAWKGKATSGIQSVIFNHTVYNIPQMAIGMKGTYPVAPTRNDADHHYESRRVAARWPGYNEVGERI